MAESSDHTGGMLALVPDNTDQLAVDGGEPVAELHLTLLFLGEDVTSWDEGQADQLRELVKASAPALDAVDARVIGHGQFNPDGGPDGDRDPCAVYLVGDAPNLDPLRAWATWVTSTHDNYPTPPEQFTPFIPHITAGYGTDPAALSFTGPIRFSTLRLALAGDVLDVPLGDTEVPVITETKSGEITFTPPASVIEVAAILPGPIARVVTEGKALNSRGVDWVAEHCGDAGVAWAAEMRERVGEIEVKRADMNMGKTAGGDRPKLDSLKDLDDAIDAHDGLPDEEKPVSKKRLKDAAKRLGADHHTHERVGRLNPAAIDDGTGCKDAAEDVETSDLSTEAEVKIASPDPRAARLRNMWAHDPKLTKKWRPGTPGDSKRLRRHLAKYVKTPKILNGLTANIHKLATGEWPGKKAHTGRGNVGKALQVATKSIDWDGVEYKEAALFTDADIAALHAGIEDWGQIFDDPSAADPTPDEGESSDILTTAHHAAMGARMVVDEAPAGDVGEPAAAGTGSEQERLFDAEPVST